MQMGTAVCQARIDRMSNAHREKEEDLGVGQEKSGLWKDNLRGDVNPPKIC